MTQAQTIEQLAALAAQTQDQTETTSGGDYTPPAEGKTIARFVEYIEIGNQPQKPYLGKPKPDCEEVFLGFELLHPEKNIREIDAEGGGKKKIADFVRIKLPVKLGEKARFKKLFNKMVYGREGIKHFAQMLGEAFIVTVTHGKSEDGKKTYVNLDKDGEWLVQAARIEDPLSGEIKIINVPANIRPLRIFLSANPTKETWDSLFIDGTREVKVDGKETQVSKNWLQELILSATDHPNSPLQGMLNNLGGLSIDAQPGKSEPTTSAEASTATASPSEAALTALADNKPVQTTVADDLAAIGL